MCLPAGYDHDEVLSTRRSCATQACTAARSSTASAPESPAAATTPAGRPGRASGETPCGRGRGSNAGSALPVEAPCSGRHRRGTRRARLDVPFIRFRRGCFCQRGHAIPARVWLPAAGDSGSADSQAARPWVRGRPHRPASSPAGQRGAPAGPPRSRSASPTSGAPGRC